jgi:hypothetical protein
VIHNPASQHMKNTLLFCSLYFGASLFVSGQAGTVTDDQRRILTTFIDQYSEAREKRDTTLLKKILTNDVDQLVSNGEWRDGIGAALDGMIRSSAGTPGTRILRVEKIKMLSATTAIVDCRYEIQNKDGSIRKMWSSFVAIDEKGTWKITAIRNMLPAAS